MADNEQPITQSVLCQCNDPYVSLTGIRNISFVIDAV